MNDDTQKSAGYLVISYKRLAWLMIITFGVYGLYWHYKNWKAIQKTDNSKIWPFWRAIFAVFWVYSLFTRIAASANGTGYKSKYSANLLAVIYISTALAGAVSGFLIRSPWLSLAIAVGLLLVELWLILTMQKAINFYGNKISLPKHETTKGEVAVIILGVIVAILAVFFTLNPPPAELSAEQKRLQDHYNQLTADYKECSTSLDVKQGTLDENDEAAVQAFAADDEKCEAIRVQQNKAADEYNASIE